MDTVKNQAGVPYVTQNAILRCPFGLMTSVLNVVDSTRASIGMNKMATISDHTAGINIAPFGMCTSIGNPEVQAATAAAMGTLTPAPCPGVQALMGWSPPPDNVITKKSRYLDQTCTLLCKFGGNIMIVHSGQGVSAPIPVPCTPLESNYEMSEWMEGAVTFVGLTPWGIGVNLLETAGNVYNGNYRDAVMGILPFKRLKKGGKLLAKPADKFLQKAFKTDTGKIVQRLETAGKDMGKKITDSTVGRAIQHVTDTRVGQALTKDVMDTRAGKAVTNSKIGQAASRAKNSRVGRMLSEPSTPPANTIGEKVVKDIGTTTVNAEEKIDRDGFMGVYEELTKDNEMGELSSNADIAMVATGLPPDEFDNYTDYGQHATAEGQ